LRKLHRVLCGDRDEWAQKGKSHREERSDEAIREPDAMALDRFAVLPLAMTSLGETKL
jgi:hypothetical protein